jgi:hypothetical protein
MLQHLIVAMIVMAAALYSGWSLMPAGARRAAAARLAARAMRWGLADERAQELERSLAAGGNCTDCSSCKGCATPASEADVDSLPAKPPRPVITVVAMPASRRSAR